MTIQERVQDVFNRFNVNLTVSEEPRVDMAEAVLENGTVIYTDGEDFAEGEEAYIINDEGERIPLPPGDYDLADGGRISIGEVGKVSKVEKPGGGDAKNVEKGTPNIDVTKPVKKKPAEDAGGGDAGGGKGAPAKGKPGKKKLTSEEDQPKDMKVEFNREEVLAVLTDRFPDLGEELAQAIASAVADVYAPEVVEEEANEEEKDEMNVNPEAPKGQSEEEAPAEELDVEVEIEVEMSEETKEKSEVDALKEALELTNARIEEMQKLAAHSGLKHKAPTPKPTQVELSKMSIEERVRALASQFNS